MNKYMILIKKHGLKLTHIAKQIRMSESLLRYHLSQKDVDEDLEKRLTEVFIKLVLAVVKTAGLSANATAFE